jgi:hypothetical protein
MESPAQAWPGRSARGSVILPLPFSLLPPLTARLVLPEVELRRKAELHLTLLSHAEAEALAQRLPETAWAKAFDEQDWAVEPIERRYLLRKPRPRGGPCWSVVQEVACPSLKTFRHVLGARVGLDLVEAFPHLTLYVAGSTRGIAVPTHEALRELRVRRLGAGEWRRLQSST